MIVLLDLINKLKLTGLKESFEYRLEEAMKDNMAHQDFLTLLLEDEALYRENLRCSRLRKKANFRDKVVLEQFETNRERGISKSMIKQMQSLKFMESFENILFIGGTGAGKSFLAQAVGHAACIAGKDTLFAPVNMLFTELECAEKSGSLLKLVQKIAKVELLILDDFALRAYSHQEATLLYQILEDRYQKGSTVITSQVGPDGWGTLFEDPVIAEAILDRIMKCAHTILLKAGNYRENHRPKEKIEIDAA